MNTFLTSIKKGVGFASGVLIFMAISVLVAEGIKTFTSGDLISASSINLNFQIASPEGTISAFYLSSCPTGWIQADGNNGTPDLRGVFIRGLNSFDGGTTSNARDPQDTGVRSLGHYQTDAFQGHKHSGTGYGSGGHNPNVGPGGPKRVSDELTPADATGSPIPDGFGTPRTSTESRPQNVSLIFCMRKDT